MSPPTSSLTTLNPFAPEYNPIPPGIAPHPHAPPPFFLPPPSSTAFHQPCRPPPSSSADPRPPPFLSTRFFTYIPSTSHSTEQPFYTNYSTYYATPQNPVATNTSPPPTQGRGCIRQRRGFRGGRGRGRENSRSSRVFGLNISSQPFSTLFNLHPFCSRKELVSLLDGFCLLENGKARNEGTSREGAEEHFTCAYDFLYLPIDFKSKRSRGFAFVNFTNARVVWKFFDAFHLKKWDFVERNKWTKRIEVVCAKIQGKEALVNHFSQSIFECETDEFLPVCFDPPRDGSGQPLELTVVGNRRATSHREPRR
ncbi:hypothetical protein Pfo_004666 [Paulownia fortunei]|nr:hypothetical protein Pfo_004666 [Paulownia fortunei]